MPKAMRLRLAFLANAFEFVDCLEDCLQSLSEEELTVEGAFTVVDDMSEELWEHEAARAILIKIIHMLVKERDEQIKRREENEEEAEEEEEPKEAEAVMTKKVRKALRQAGEVLGRALGFVNKMFDEGAATPKYPSCRGFKFYKVLPLRADIKGLSPEVMWVLLGSETLQLRSENDAYYLLCAWLSQSEHTPDEEGREALFRWLFPLLRFHQMSHDFLCSVVSACPYVSASGLLPYVMRRSHARRTAPSCLNDVERDAVVMGSEDRIKGGLKRILKSQLELADFLPLKKSPSHSNRIYKFLGLAFGFPVGVDVQHKAQGEMGVYSNVGMPDWEMEDFEGEVERHADFNFSVKIGKKNLEADFLFDNKETWGWHNFFEKSWETVVCPDSPYFPKGMLPIVLIMRPIKRK